jgi:hypothetical protein
MSLLFYRGEQSFRARVIAEGGAEMREQVDVSGAEYETGAKLKRVLSQFMLPMAGRTGAFSRGGIFALE